MLSIVLAQASWTQHAAAAEIHDQELLVTCCTQGVSMWVLTSGCF